MVLPPVPCAPPGPATFGTAIGTLVPVSPATTWSLSNVSESERKDKPMAKVYPWTQDLIIIEKYDDFLYYIYPILQRMPRLHGILKDDVIKLVLSEVDLLYKAIKSNQISKLYEADGGLAAIRHRLRFLSNENIKLISLKQSQVAQVKLDEVGRILGSIINKRGK